MSEFEADAAADRLIDAAIEQSEKEPQEKASSVRTCPNCEAAQVLSRGLWRCFGCGRRERA